MSKDAKQSAKLVDQTKAQKGTEAKGVRVNKQVEAVKSYVLAKIEPLPLNKCEAEAEKIKGEEDFANCEVNSAKVVKILSGFHLV